MEADAHPVVNVDPVVLVGQVTLQLVPRLIMVMLMLMVMVIMVVMVMMMVMVMVMVTIVVKIMVMMMRICHLAVDSKLMVHPLKPPKNGSN